MPGEDEINIGLITTWNSRCGVANYSKYLVNHTPKDSHVKYTIFARKDQTLVAEDEGNVIRCWENQGNIDELLAAVKNQGIQLVSIMFSGTFFTGAQLASLIVCLKKQRVQVIIAVHDTIEPIKDISTELSAADAVIVFKKDDVRRLKSHGVFAKIMFFPQGILDFADEDRHVVRKSMGITNSRVLASTGFLLPDKGILEVINALPALVKSCPDILYLIVCSLHMDPSSEKYYIECKDSVHRLNLEEHVKFQVEYLQEQEVMNLLHVADIILILRKATAQPTSAALRFALSARRPVITTDAPIFGDFGPEVYKIADPDPLSIANAVNALFSNESRCEEMIQAARLRIGQDSWESISRQHVQMALECRSSPNNWRKSLKIRLQIVLFKCSSWLKALPRRITALPGTLINSVVTIVRFAGLKPALRKILKSLLLIILQNDRLRKVGKRLLQNHPKFRIILLKIAGRVSSNGVITQLSITKSPASNNPSNAIDRLPEHARTIYNKLHEIYLDKK